MTRWGASVRFSCRAVLPLFLLVGCYGSSSVGGAPRRSTETGNPPVIDVTKVALVVKLEEVHVIGEEGAVSPGGSKLEVETLSSGDSVTGLSDARGAFDIKVEGSIDDAYRLRALGAAPGEDSAPVYLYRGGASVGEGDGGTFSCEQRAGVIDHQLTAAADAVDHECETNADCTLVSGPVDCPGWVCSGAALSQTGALQVAASLDAIRGGTCQQFDDAGCWMSWPVPDCVNPSPAACVEGQCVDCAKEDCSGVSCDACDTPEITWAPTGPTIGDSHTLIDCKTLVTNFADGSPQCSTTLPCTVSRGDGVWSFAHLQNLLGDPTVSASLAASKRFGPAMPTGVRVTIGDRSITMGGDTACTPLTCGAAPEPIQRLFALLDSIALDQSCASGPNPGEACDMPFDPGTGLPSIPVFAFDGALGTCVPRRYSGAGGNANRFDSFESCSAACPQTASSDSCASDRTYVADACLSCAPDACLLRAGACMLRCTDPSVCTDEGLSTCGVDGTCGIHVGGCL